LNRAVRSDCVDLLRQSFGEWLVLTHAGARGGDTYWLCRCSCGAEKTIKRASLVTGRSKSCGCLRPKGAQWTADQHRAAKRKWKAANPEARRRDIQLWRERHPDRARESSRRTNYRTKFGMEYEDLVALLASQGGVCAICRTPIDDLGRGIGKGAVDHCHASGKVRGVLCAQCNCAIGLFRDDPVRLRSAIEYLS
jgi:hypothetical protein